MNKFTKEFIKAENNNTLDETLVSVIDTCKYCMETLCDTQEKRREFTSDIFEACKSRLGQADIKYVGYYRWAIREIINLF